MTCVISCITGLRFTKVYPAPTICPAFFYTNNPALRSEIEAKGWIYKFLDLPLSTDQTVSSCQAKYVKFLQFKVDPGFQNVIYTDHKLNLQDGHIIKLQYLKEKPVLIRYSPRVKTVEDEISAARSQKRYSVFEAKTRQYVSEKLAAGYSGTARVCATGLILYDLTNSSVRSLVDEMYNDIQKVGTPECQIIWVLVSQKYDDIIQCINWDDVAIPWASP